MPTEEQLIVPEKLKARLFPVVLALFSENDFHQVNIREISRISGVSSGTLYKYFSSKEALVFSILEQEIDKLGGNIKLHIAGMVDTKEIFRKVFWSTMNFYDNNPGVAVTAFITVPMRSWMQEGRFMRGDESVIFSEPLKKAREKGGISADVSDRQILDLYYMHCYRHIHQWYFFGMKESLADTVPNFFELFWKVLKP